MVEMGVGCCGLCALMDCFERCRGAVTSPGVRRRSCGVSPTWDEQSGAKPPTSHKASPSCTLPYLPSHSCRYKTCIDVTTKFFLYKLSDLILFYYVVEREARRAMHIPIHSLLVELENPHNSLTMYLQIHPPTPPCLHSRFLSHPPLHHCSIRALQLHPLPPFSHVPVLLT